MTPIAGLIAAAIAAASGDVDGARTVLAKVDHPGDFDRLPELRKHLLGALTAVGLADPASRAGLTNPSAGVPSWAAA